MSTSGDGAGVRGLKNCEEGDGLNLEMEIVLPKVTARPEQRLIRGSVEDKRTGIDCGVDPGYKLKKIYFWDGGGEYCLEQ